jgi:hypothetical protein
VSYLSNFAYPYGKLAFFITNEPLDAQTGTSITGNIPLPPDNIFALFDPPFSEIGADVPVFLIDTGGNPI